MRTFTIQLALLCVLSAPASPQFPNAAPPPAAGPDMAAWNMRFSVPPGWEVSRTVGRLQVLASNTEAGALFVSPGMYRDFNEVGVDVAKFYQAMNLPASPLEQPVTTRINGMQALTALYGSYDQIGQVVLSRGVAIISEHGTGLIIIGMTNQQQMPQMRQRVDQLAASFQVSGPPRVNQELVRALAGRWMYYEGRANTGSRVTGGASRSHEEFVQFDGVGQFSYESSSSVNVTTPGYTGAAGGAQATSDAGSYTVIGNTLVLRGQQGQLTFEIAITGNQLTADGRMYLRSN